MATLTRQQLRERRHRRVRRKVAGTSERPRLVVRRSNRGIEGQLVDDLDGRTLASASWLHARDVDGNKSDQARAVGRLLAERARAAGVETVVFDRAGYRFHGRVKALAEGAREGGLKF